MTPLLRLLATLALFLAAIVPAQAAVTITFWSHELGNSFPHSFFTLRGIPDGGGTAVDVNYGFTARSVSPAILFGTVPGRLDIATPGYMAGSDAQFAVVLTDAWSEERGDSRYRLDGRNCIDFVKEAARIAGLEGLDQPKLMRRPTSYLKAVAAANPARIIRIGMHGKAYLTTLRPLAPIRTAASMPAPVR